MTFESKSQAGQDAFVYHMLGKPTEPGTYLELGANEAINCNNTYAFEKLGWSGLSIDIDEKYKKDFDENRKNAFIIADTTTLDWNQTLPQYFGESKLIDYLSFDVDEASRDTFIRFPFDMYEFKVITIEHDVYRFGPDTRNMMRRELSRRGYHLICHDVRFNGGMFEDWWVNPKYVNMDYAYKYICIGEEYKTILSVL